MARPKNPDVDVNPFTVRVPESVRAVLAERATAAGEPLSVYVRRVLTLHAWDHAAGSDGAVADPAAALDAFPRVSLVRSALSPRDVTPRLKGTAK